MAEYSQSYWRGLLVLDQRIKPANLDSANSTYTEAGPVAGVPEPQQTSALLLDAKGDQSTDGQLRVQVSQSGIPGYANLRVIHQEEGDTAWLGWNEPGTVTYYESPATVDATTEFGQPHIVALPNDKALLTYSDMSSGSGQIFRSRTRSVAGTWGSEVTIKSGITKAAQWDELTDGGFCSVVMPSGRVLFFYATSVAPESSNDFTIGMFYTDDDGATWQTGSRDVLGSAVATLGTGTGPRILRGAQSNGQILLMLTHVVTGPTYTVVQYASSDGGATFTQIESTASRWTGTCCALPEGGFLVGATDSGSFAFNAYLIGSAYQAAEGQGVSLGEINSDISTNSASAWVDLDVMDNGTVYVIGTGSGLGEVTAAYSPLPVHLGASWRGMGTPFSQSGTSVLYGSACFLRGRVLLAHQVAGTDASEHYVMVAHLGGFATVEFPRSSGQQQACPPCRWWPSEAPADMGWVESGTATNSLLPGSALVVTTSTNQWQATATETGEVDNGVIALAYLTQTSGTAALYLQTADGSESYEVSIRYDGTNLIVYDERAGANVTSTAVADDPAVLVAVAGGVVSCWYINDGGGAQAPIPGSQTWTNCCDAQSLTDSGAENANLIEFGTLKSAATHSVSFRQVNYAVGSEVGRQLATGQTNPDDLWGRPVSTEWTYLSDGVSVRAKGGPGYIGQEFDVDAAHRYAIEHLHPLTSPSPRRKWRSTASTDEVVAWTVDSVADSYPPSPLLGVYLDGLTSPVVEVTTVQAAGNDTQAYDLRQRVKWTRKGKSVRLEYATTSGVEMEIKPDELVGWALQFGTGTSGDVRRINRNTGGLLRSAGTVVKPIVYLDDIDDGEGTTGDGFLWPTRALLVKPIDDAGSEWPSGIRLTFGDSATAPVPPEGYHEAGVACVGWLVPFGKQPDRTRRRNFMENVQREERPDGSRSTRRRGPVRESVTLSLSQLDTRPWYSSTADDHIFGSSSDDQPAAHRHWNAPWLEGLIDHLDGENTPVVYFTRLDDTRTDAAPGAAYVLRNAGGALYGRIVGGITVSTELGDEHEDELVSLSMTIEEEV